MFQYVQSRKRTKIKYEGEDDTVCKENPVSSKHSHPSWYVTILFCRTRKIFYELVVCTGLASQTPPLLIWTGGERVWFHTIKQLVQGSRNLLPQSDCDM